MEWADRPFLVAPAGACGVHSAVIAYYAEAVRWEQGTTWLGLLNPLRTAQDVRVSILGRDIVRTVSVPPRGRTAVELGSWGRAWWWRY